MKALFLFLLIPALSFAGTVHEVKMVNKDSQGRAMMFEPIFIQAKKGDSIKFIPTDKAHSVESVKDGLPAGVEHWKGGINKEITVKLDVEGVHAFRCVPHLAMGMVGAVQVGPATNLEQIKKLQFRGKAKKIFDEEVIAKIK